MSIATPLSEIQRKIMAARALADEMDYGDGDWAGDARRMLLDLAELLEGGVPNSIHTMIELTESFGALREKAESLADQCSKARATVDGIARLHLRLIEERDEQLRLNRPLLDSILAGADPAPRTADPVRALAYTRAALACVLPVFLEARRGGIVTGSRLHHVLDGVIKDMTPEISGILIEFAGGKTSTGGG